jgi:hypothetical protein
MAKLLFHDSTEQYVGQRYKNKILTGLIWAGAPPSSSEFDENREERRFSDRTRYFD